MDILSISETLSRAQKLLLKPLSPTVAERESHTNIKSYTKSKRKKLPVVSTHINKKVGKGDNRNGLYGGESYRNALNTLDELTLEMKGKMRDTIRRSSIKETKRKVEVKYDEEKVCKMNKNIEKLEKQLETVKGAANQNRFHDTTGIENAKARLKSQHRLKQSNSSWKPIKVEQCNGMKDEEKKIKLLQQRAANTLRGMARERRQRLQNEMIKIEEDRRRRSLDEEKALKEQRAAAERVADRIRQTRIEEAKKREKEEENRQERISSNKKKVMMLQRRTKQRIKSVIGKNGRRQDDDDDVIPDSKFDYDRVEYARRMAAIRAHKAQHRLIQEREKEAAEEAARLELQRQQKNDMMKRYRTRSAGVTGYSGMPQSLIDVTVNDDDDDKSSFLFKKSESIKLPPINRTHKKAIEDNVRVVAKVRYELMEGHDQRTGEALEDISKDNVTEFATPEALPSYSLISSSSPTSSSSSIREDNADGEGDLTLLPLIESNKWRPVVPMMDDEYFLKLVKHGMTEKDINKGYSLKYDQHD